MDNVAEQLYCKSYYDDKNILQDCTCGRCDMSKLEIMISKMKDITIWHDTENYKEARWVAKATGGLESGETLEEAVSKLYKFLSFRGL